MKLIEENTLENAIKDIDSFDDEDVLYVRKPWNKNSQTYVYTYGEGENSPLDINSIPYFLEVFIVKEVIEVLKEHTKNMNSDINEVCKAVIYYAENDAYIK